MQPNSIQIVRFWAKVDRQPACWLRHTSLMSNGYARVTTASRKLLAHRFAWEIAGGTMPTRGIDICHTCHTRNCVRNDDDGVFVFEGVEYERHGHLFLAPHQVNQRHMAAEGRHAWQAPGVHTGINNGRAIVDEVAVREIRKRATDRSSTYREIGREFGLSRIQVKSIALRRAWKHVNETS